MLEPHPVESVNEVLAGGQPIKSREYEEPTAAITVPERMDWMFAITSEFRKEVSKLDKKLGVELWKQLQRYAEIQRLDTAIQLNP